MTTAHYIRIKTEVTYPDGGPKYDKWDYFYIKDTELPDEFRENADPEKFYFFLNENGYWVKGWQEISPEEDAWLDKHPEVWGSQEEVATEVEYK